VPRAQMQADTLRELAATVQRNCDLADAAHAQELSLCVYLLQMREFFRWERGLPLDVVPERSDVGRWIGEREARWQSLADAPAPAFTPLPIGAGVDPFDEAPVNDALAAHGLVYAAGLARFRHPEFLLAERLATRCCEGATVVITGREHARGLNPPLAASRGDQILVRRDLLRRWLGTRVELSQQRPGAEALGAAIDAWRGRGDAHDTLERITDEETETLILHELGERRAAALLGPRWERMLASLASRRSEIVARALRDLLADCATTLPALLERDARASIHFWFANLEGVRGLLGAGLRATYSDWRGNPASPARARVLSQALERQRERWLALAARLLAAWESDGERGVDAFSDALLAEAGSGRPPG